MYMYRYQQARALIPCLSVSISGVVLLDSKPAVFLSHSSSSSLQRTFARPDGFKSLLFANTVPESNGPDDVL